MNGDIQQDLLNYNASTVYGSVTFSGAGEKNLSQQAMDIDGDVFIDGATFNAGAIYWQGKYLLAVRVEGNDRKSFFAIAESPNGIDHFQFWDYPIRMPETDRPDTNVDRLD